MPADQELNDYLPPWLKEYLDSIDSPKSEEFLREYAVGIGELLNRFATLDLNKVPDGTERGRMSVLLPGGLHVSLKESLLAVAKLVGPLILASSMAAPLLGQLGIVYSPQIASSVLSATIALYNAVSKLSAVEIHTYRAVAAAIEQNNNEKQLQKSASVKEIVNSFRRDQKNLVQPNNLQAVLTQLAEKKVLKSDASTGTLRYSLAF